MMTTTSTQALGQSSDYRERVLRSVRYALEQVEYYAKRAIPPPDDTLSLDEALKSLPLLTRSAMQSTLPRVWMPSGRDLKAELARGAVSLLETGSGDARIRVLRDASWWQTQHQGAMASHPVVRGCLEGAHGPYREAFLWGSSSGTGSCGGGDSTYEDRLVETRLELNSRQDPTFWSELVMTRMLDELDRHGTVGLFADPFYLSVLARHAVTHGRNLDVSGFVALTRAVARSGQRALLQRVYSGSTIDFVSRPETGVMFMSDGGVLHHVPIATHVELLHAKVPAPGAEGLALVVATTLDREVQPLVRFVTGDLVRIGRPTASDGSAVFASLEGTVDEVLVRPDGAVVTAGAVDRALAPLKLEGYQVTQRGAEVDLEIVGPSASPTEAGAALGELLSGMNLRSRVVSALAVGPNGEYRTVTRQAPLVLSATFEGVA